MIPISNLATEELGLSTHAAFFDSNRFLFMKYKMGGQKEKELGMLNVAVLDRIPFREVGTTVMKKSSLQQSFWFFLIQ